MELATNTILQGGKYKIIEKIGQGGFGIAYRAIHQGLKTEVCIKEFFYCDLCERSKNSSDITIISKSVEKIKLVDSLQKKFTKEAQRLARFQHTNIVQVTDNFDENNTAYFVMEFLEGGSLEDLIKREGDMSEQKAKALILPIIDAMDAVHKKDLLHLDIKPANIMLRKNQSPVLIDFGISKYLETANGNTTTAPIGISKGYAPLEQYGGSITDFSKATDIYSLCATIYNMVTGLTPPEPLQMITSGFKSPRDLRPQLTADFNAAILKGLATKAVDRQQSMAQLKTAFGETKKVVESHVQTVIAPNEEVLKTATEFHNRAEKKRKNKEYEAAIKDYNEAIKKNAKNEDYYFFRGLCYYELENYNAAIKNYSKVIDLNPNEDAAYYNRGLCYSQLGKHCAASLDFFKAYELKQKVIYFNQWLKMADKSEDVETIDKYLLNEKWLNKDKVYFTRGEIYLKKGDFTKACDDFFRAYQSSKNDKYLKSWKSSEDINILNNYLERDLPNKDEVLFNRGKLRKDAKSTADDFYEAYQISKKDKYIEYWQRIPNIEVLSIYLEKDLPNKDEVKAKIGDIYLKNAIEKLVDCKRNEYKELLDKSTNTGNLNAKLVSKRILIDGILLFPLLLLDIATGFLINYLIEENNWGFSDFPILFWVILIFWIVLPFISANTKATIVNSKSILFYKKLHIFIFFSLMLILFIYSVFFVDYEIEYLNKNMYPIFTKIIEVSLVLMGFGLSFIVFTFWHIGIHHSLARNLDYSYSSYKYKTQEQILIDLTK